MLHEGVPTADDSNGRTIITPNHWRFALQIRCDAPFGYQLEAKYGALTMPGLTDVPPGFTTAVPYHVSAYMDAGGLAVYSSCSGSLLRARSPHCSGQSGSAQESTLRVRMDLAEGDAVPLAGDYSETIRVFVGPIY